MNSAFTVTEADIEAAIDHYADWEGFPRFDVLASDLERQDLGFVSFPVRAIVARAARILGRNDGAFVRKILGGGNPDEIVPLLREASGIVEAAINQCPYEVEFVFGALPTKRIRAPWEHVHGPYLTLVESLLHEPPKPGTKWQRLFAAVAIWAIYRARRLAAKDPLDAESYVAEAMELLLAADRCDEISAQVAGTAKRGLDGRYRDSRKLKRAAFDYVWKMKMPGEKHKEAARRIEAMSSQITFEQAMGWIKEWRRRERKDLPGMEE